MIARQTPVRAALWFEIDCRLEAAIHMERHRFMFMHDFPLLVDLSEAERVTKPKIVLPSGRVCSLYSVKAVAEGNIAADRDIQFISMTNKRRRSGQSRAP
jgi:hypothetical protein